MRTDVMRRDVTRRYAMDGDRLHRFIAGLILVFSVVLPVAAEDRAEHGNWISQYLQGMGQASTQENDQSMFGMVCGEGRCRYYFANGLDCEPSVNYPLMITTDLGAVPVEAVCEPMPTDSGEMLLYWFAEMRYLNEAFEKTPTIGIAFPLTNGEFKFSRFSMNGFSDAVKRVAIVMRDSKSLEPAQEQTQEPTPGQTPELTLERTPGQIPEQIPEQTPRQTPEPTPERTSEPTSVQTPEPTPEPTSVQIPEPTPEPTEEQSEELAEDPTEEPAEEPIPKSDQQGEAQPDRT